MSYSVLIQRLRFNKRNHHTKHISPSLLRLNINLQERSRLFKSNHQTRNYFTSKVLNISRSNPTENPQVVGSNRPPSDTRILNSTHFYNQNQSIDIKSSNFAKPIPSKKKTNNNTDVAAEIGQILEKKQLPKDKEGFQAISGLDNLAPKVAAGEILEMVQHGRIPEPAVFKKTIIRMSRLGKEDRKRSSKEIFKLYETMKKYGMRVDTEVFHELFAISTEVKNETLTRQLERDMETFGENPKSLIELTKAKAKEKNMKTSNNGSSMNVTINTTIIGSSLTNEMHPEIKYFDQNLTTVAEVDPRPHIAFRPANYEADMKLGFESLYGEEEEYRLLSKEEKELMIRQQQNETKQVILAQQRYEELITSVKKLGRGATLGPAERLLVEWYEPLNDSIKSEQNDIRNGICKSAGSDRFGDYLLMLPSDQLAVITMHSVLGLLLLNTTKKSGSSRAIPFNRAILSVADAVQAESNLSRLKMEEAGLFKYMNRNNPSVIKVNRMAKWNIEDGKWSKNVLTYVGGTLVNILLDTAQISSLEQAKSLEPILEPDLEETDIKPVRKAKKTKKVIEETEEDEGEEDEIDEPETITTSLPTLPFNIKNKNNKGFAAFRYDREAGTLRATGMLVPHEKLLKILGEGDSNKGETIPIRSVVNAKFLPMICIPKPWRGPDDGGYLYYSNYIMRTKGIRLHKEVLESGGNLEKVYKGLNALNETPWRVNSRVFNVMDSAWAQGGGIGELPSKQDIPIPPEPQEDPDKKNQWKRIFKRITQQNRDLKGLRCDTNYKLNVAREFLSENKLFFPHSMDFRGRTYPIPPHLNHIGADICRSLLLFYEGKQLGKRGFDWLKIHLANVYGHDKISFDDRIKFVDNHIEEILDSATNPLGGKRWWLNAEAPWQCLGTCFEFADALKNPGGPEYFISNLPIHQDGTCNGLQHYAALGKDVFGGQEVNLLPAAFPQDVYSTVAALVRKRVDEDAKDGHPQALILQGKIERKIVKQTVMTSVYGVTYIGARQQISNAMQDRGVVRDEDLWKASSYIAKLTFAALREMFVCARAIMDWLGICAKEIAKKGHTVKWETPLGLPIVQPYKKEKGTRDHIKTLVQKVCLKSDEHLPINVHKQKSAFPPNYIHSLDSSHMLLTASAMKENNLTYASVHDSYWTHAATVDQMNVVLRQKFIELHSEPILERLLDYFKKNYPDCTFPPVPPRGELDLNKVLESPYFFN